MRILGIDPGSRITGFGVIELGDRHPQYIGSGCIRTGEGELPERIKVIFDSLCKIIETYQPGEVAIEKVFMHRNADSALKLGQARGAALCAVMTRNLPVNEYSPSEIKQAIVGHGHASKEQIQHMVISLLQLPASPQADAADALAAALCHAHTDQTLRALHGVQGARGGRYR